MASSSPPRWQLRTTQDAGSSVMTPVPSGCALLRLASAPHGTAVWVGTVLSAHEAPCTIAVKLVPAGEQIALRVSRFAKSPTPAPLTCGSAGARRSASGGACTASMGDAIMLFGDQRPLQPPGVARDASVDDALVLWALRPFPSGGVPPSAARVPARPATPGGDMPRRRQFAAAACVGGRLYVVGGAAPGVEQGAFDQEPPPGAALWDAWVFTPDDASAPEDGGAWAPLPLRGDVPAGEPPGLRGAAAVLLSPEDPAAARLLLLGGCTNSGLSSDALAVHLASGVVERLSRSSDQDAPRPSPRAHAAAVLLPGGRVLLAGGGSERADAADAAWLFDAHARAWAPVHLADCEGGHWWCHPGRSVFGQHTLVATLPASSVSDSDAAELLVWGGLFRVLPRGAAPHQACTIMLGQMQKMRLEARPS